MKLRAKPKIICTLGTTTDDPEVLKQMIRYGMNCARLNTAYATIQDYENRIKQVKRIANIPIMMDIKGPQVRVKAEYNMAVRKGDEIMLGFEPGIVYFNKDFINDIKVGDRILF